MLSRKLFIDCFVTVLLSLGFLYRVYLSFLVYNQEWVETVNYVDTEANLTFPSLTVCPVFDRLNMGGERNLTRLHQKMGTRQEILPELRHTFTDGYKIFKRQSEKQI